MAPDTVEGWLKDLPPNSRVLDPMCGSGVVVRQAAMLGHTAIGYDIDPLAVLMSRVWTRRPLEKSIRAVGAEVVRSARKRRVTHAGLEWVKACNETRLFIEYWYEERQRNDLARLIAAIADESVDQNVADILRLSVSRIIVTKQAGASVAWDTSHSRPHKRIENNEYNVYEGFVRSLSRLLDILEADRPKRSARIMEGDCRDLRLKSGSIDAVITSPPYLNAIDYLRGHKLSLVWFGHTIPELRARRSGAVGTERAMLALKAPGIAFADLARGVQEIDALPRRQRSIVHKYAIDADAVLNEMNRVLAADGLMVLVLGDSHLRGHDVKNSEIFAWLAKQRGFELTEQTSRPLVDSRRYLPIQTNSDLGKRMRHEVVQAYRKVA